MTMPLRKDQAEAEQLTTADLAGTRNANDVAQADVEAGRAKPVRSERNADLQAEPRPGSAAADSTPLFPDDQLKDLQARWDDIQTGFVDEPRSAVEHADSLVASTMQQLAEAFAKERSKLEQQWDRGDNISTEDLRMAFQRYRSFFRRLLSL
ncbi:MAG: hypothetical protein DMG82_02175 [Acidobacteria bacterium]|jgi:hypothetical protein|nr:MAG: hypothetical protein DMG82_02175 [Acidobacteriota bacterium]